MSNIQKKIFLLICSALYFVLPYIGSRIKWKGTKFPNTPEGYPPGYGLFTDQKIIEPPPFNETVFFIVAIGAFFLTVFLIFPRLFGFKKIECQSKEIASTPFPYWFAPSLVVFILSWVMMWARWPKPVDEFSFVPLWWSFIFLLDAIVYKRNKGKSIFSTKPQVFKLMFLVSSVAWFSFEYINFFFVELWYYPNNKVFTNFGFIFWYLLSFTVVWRILEFYVLLRTFKPLALRYSDGPKISLPTSIQIILLFTGFVLAFCCGLYPRPLFWGIWVYPLLILASALSLTNNWTPFKPLKKGDWSFVILIGFATLCNGFFYELWNEGSEYFHPNITDNPNFWMYSIPYLDKYYIFSRMPVLGYYGYIIFGSIVWSMWLFISNVLNIPSDFDPTGEQKENI